MTLCIGKLPFKKCLPIIYTLETFINDAPQLGGLGYLLLTFLDKDAGKQLFLCNRGSNMRDVIYE